MKGKFWVIKARRKKSFKLLLIDNSRLFFRELSARKTHFCTETYERHRSECDQFINKLLTTIQSQCKKSIFILFFYWNSQERWHLQCCKRSQFFLCFFHLSDIYVCVSMTEKWCLFYIFSRKHSHTSHECIIIS